MAERIYIDPGTGAVSDAEPRSFDLILRELGEGSTLSELSEAFRDVIHRVQETAKAGSVTLHLDIVFDGQGRLVVKDQVKHKLPEFSRPETRFFVDREGNASRRDPNQPTLPTIDDARARREQEAN